MSFTNLTTKTELVKSLQYFVLIVKFYTNVILTQNVVIFFKDLCLFARCIMPQTTQKRSYRAGQ